MGLVETQAFMPIPNVLKSMQGFADLTYCGHLVIMECVVGRGGLGLILWWKTPETLQLVDKTEICSRHFTTMPTMSQSTCCWTYVVSGELLCHYKRSWRTQSKRNVGTNICVAFKLV